MGNKVRVTVNQQQEQLLLRLAADESLEAGTAAEVLRYGFNQHARQHPELLRPAKAEGASPHE